jgi:hypothetical protein
MNKKQVGSSLRRGIAAGTLAGFFAGWMSFTAHSKQLDAVENEAMQSIREHEANLFLPPLPAVPSLQPVTVPARYGVTTGPEMPALVPPGGAGAAAAPSLGPVPVAAPVAQQPAAAPAPVVAPAPVPTFAPLPKLPPTPAPKPTTKPSGA